MKGRLFTTWKVFFHLEAPQKNFFPYTLKTAFLMKKHFKNICNAFLNSCNKKQISRNKLLNCISKKFIKNYRIYKMCHLYPATSII